MHEFIKSTSLAPADQCHKSILRRRSTFPLESISFALRKSLYGEHATQVHCATNGAERPGKQVKRMSFDVQNCANECQLFQCETRVFLSADFVPGVFTHRTDSK